MRRAIHQETIVFALSLLMLVGFSIFLSGFASPENIIALIRNVSVLGILGTGMALVIIGRGIDLAAISVMAMSVAWGLSMSVDGAPLLPSLMLGLAFAVAVGLVTGLIIAYVKVPPLFATLAVSLIVYGVGLTFMIPLDIIYLPKDSAWLEFFGKGRVLGIPMPVVLFAITAGLASWFLSKSKIGRTIYAIGDNFAAARLIGLPVERVIVLQYVISSLVAFAAGIITAAAVSSMNTRIATSSLVYDVILVVVLGGIGLNGGKGSVRNVVAGTLLVGTLLNGMTIMDVQYTTQNIIKGLILLLAITIDTLVNPRDEQTAQHGDI
ncbi:MAG: ABC transporter permease [Rhizobiaceae bacterium]|nr:ABC transporter permease [Rhizobiaceae bacterium]